MGTYEIPRNLRGETRILYIFTIKSLISTAAGIGLGALFYLIFNMLGLKIVGLIVLAVFAGIGYLIGAVKIPEIAGLRFTKNISGEPLSEIMLRFFKFRTKQKMYSYISTKEEKDE